MKSFQQKVITNYAEGKDCFCVAGTGAGKSLTYILCPVIMDLQQGLTVTTVEGTLKLESVVLIIQPLKSLMKDQKQKLTDLKLKCIYLGEEDGVVQSWDVTGTRKGDYNYIIAAPESMVSDRFLSVLENLRDKIKCVFVDESHCIQTL